MPVLTPASIQAVARISLRSLEIVLYVHTMAEPGVNAKYDCVAWSDGNHTTKRKAWRMRVGVIPTLYEVRVGDLHKQLHALRSAMDKARESTGIAAPEYRRAMNAALLLRSEIDELARDHWLAISEAECIGR